MTIRRVEPPAVGAAPAPPYIPDMNVAAGPPPSFSSDRSSAPRGRVARFARLLRRVVLAAALIVVVVQLWFALQVALLNARTPSSSAFMDAERDRLAAQAPIVEIRHQPVEYARIAAVMPRAIIAAEDGKFMSHWGVDWSALRAAAKTNERRGRVALGGSTITMQLAKNLYLSADRSYWRKGQEIVIAHMMEAMLSKRRIMELYLNFVEFGEGVFGVEAAALHYFRKSAAQLTPREAAWLAAILPSPRRYDRERRSAFAARKATIILRRMNAVAAP